MGGRHIGTTHFTFLYVFINLVCFLISVVLILYLDLNYCVIYNIYRISQRIEPYAIGSATRLNGHPESKATSGENLSVLTENTSKRSFGRLSVSQNSDPLVKEAKPLERLSISQNSDPAVEDSKFLACMLPFILLSSAFFILFFSLLII